MGVYDTVVDRRRDPRAPLRSPAPYGPRRLAGRDKPVPYGSWRRGVVGATLVVARAVHQGSVVRPSPVAWRFGHWAHVVCLPNLNGEESQVAFNGDLCAEIAKSGDRNYARYFAGRDAEQRAFEAALTESTHQTQSVFRIYQGAPGSGKTSLVRRLSELHGGNDSLLFVILRDEDLTSHWGLLDRVVDAALAKPAGTPLDNTKAALLRYGEIAFSSATEMLRIKSAGAALAEWRRQRAVGDLTVVLAYDEAQNLGDDQRRTLAGLHAHGIEGVRSVLLLSGLSHTTDVLSGGGIVSRPADDAVCIMGALHRAESIRSTEMMFAELDPDGTPEQRRALTEHVAELSCDWPQHLNRAQNALCEELLKADGDLSQVDKARIERDTTAARHRFYERRLQGSDLAVVPHLTHRIIVALDKAGRVGSPVDSLSALRRLCRQEIEAARLHADPDFGITPAAYADALILKGVACEDGDGSYAVPIPSMVQWASDRQRAHQCDVGLSR